MPVDSMAIVLTCAKHEGRQSIQASRMGRKLSNQAESARCGNRKQTKWESDLVACRA